MTQVLNVHKRVLDIEKIIEETAIDPLQIERAIKRAAFRVMKSFKTTLSRNVARKTAVPLKLIRKRVHAFQPKKNGDGDITTGLSMLTFDLPAILLPGVRMGKKGVETRAYSFRNSFTADNVTRRRGKSRSMILNRTTHRRYPLNEARVPIEDDAIREFKDLEKTVMEKFLKNLEHEVKFRGGLLGDNSVLGNF